MITLRIHDATGSKAEAEGQHSEQQGLGGDAQTLQTSMAWLR